MEVPAGGHAAAWARSVKYMPNRAAKNISSEPRNSTMPTVSSGIRLASRVRVTEGVASGRLIGALGYSRLVTGRLDGADGRRRRPAQIVIRPTERMGWGGIKQGKERHLLKERDQRARAPKRLRNDLWVGLKPYGVGDVKPNHYGEIARTVWENRDSLPYAWRIMRQGVCDGCALGVAGFHDWTIKGVHLCTTRLNLLRLNTMGPLNPEVLEDVESLRGMSGAQLRALGRLPYPMRRRSGERGFTRIRWD